ncbi:MAG: hypothetical protein NTX25_23755 [Proteobacteria bacterium]|nr:hypothetical protein [Pseudomonadota bacterium]
MTIKCGGTEFKLEDGNDGRNGLAGMDGRDGKDGQDNFSTELSESDIIGDVTMGSDVVECSVKIRSNDQNLLLRPFFGYLLSDGQILLKDRIFPQYRTQEFDRIKFKVKLYRDFMKPLLPLQCRAAIFADREVPYNNPIALTAYSVSAAKIVQDSPRVLQSANDFDKTVIPSVEGNDILKLALRNTNSPSPSSQCNAKLNFDADVYDRSTEKTIARLNIERELEHTPIDNENILAFDLNDFSSPKNSNVRNVRLFITCNGDKEYKSYMHSKDRHKRNFEIQGTFLPKP